MERISVDEHGLSVDFEVDENRLRQDYLKSLRDES